MATKGPSIQKFKKSEELLPAEFYKEYLCKVSDFYLKICWRNKNSSEVVFFAFESSNPHRNALGTQTSNGHNLKTILYFLIL